LNTYRLHLGEQHGERCQQGHEPHLASSVDRRRRCPCSWYKRGRRGQSVEVSDVASRHTKGLNTRGAMLRDAKKDVKAFLSGRCNLRGIRDPALQRHRRRQSRAMSRKSSVAFQGRTRGDSGSSDGSPPYSGPALSYPLTFVLTPVEAHKVQVALSKVGLAESPKRDITVSALPTPPPSYPSTPVSGLAPRNSPFQPFSTISDSTSTASNAAEPPRDARPHLRLALLNAFHDDVLPKSSRSALRAFFAGLMVNYTMKSLIPLAMRRNT
jgi:hypothetical protein